MSKCRFDLSEDCYNQDCLTCVLEKISAEIKHLRNFRAENYDIEQYCDSFDARIIFMEDVLQIIDKYKAEREETE